MPIAGWDAEERINADYTEGPQQLVDTIRNDFGIEAVDKQDGWYDMTEARISRLIDTVLDAIMLRYKAL